MDIRKKQRAVVEALEDIKGRDILVYDTARMPSMFERVVIASGDSNRQVKALADNGQKFLAIEQPRALIDDGRMHVVTHWDAVLHQ